MPVPPPNEPEDDLPEATPPGDDALERMAERILHDGLDEDSTAETGDEPGGLTWIRSTLQAGGDAEDELVGSLFHGKYRILRKIGSGGFGVVYDALDERGAQNRVALKIMLPSLTQSASPLDMFRGEAVRVTRLNHPNIVDWKNFDCTPDGRYYFVMELLDGQQLSKILEQEGALEWRRAAKIMLQILDALRAAHFVGEGQSILHLDLTPKNILLLPERRSRPETVKVIDFGIGQYLGGDELEPLEAPSRPARVPAIPARHPGKLRTVTSGTKDEQRFRERAAKYPFKISQACTPEYASPEQCVHIEFADGADGAPRQLDGRADLYSFGVIAYRMLSGRLPFRKPTLRALYLRLHQETPIEPFGDAENQVPAALRRFVERCLAKRSEDRFADTQEAYEVLERLLRPAVWRKLVIAAVALVLFGIAIAQIARRPEETFTLLERPGSARLDRLHFDSEHRSARVFAAVDADASDVTASRESWRLTRADGLPLAGWSVTAGDSEGWLRIEVDPESLLDSDGRLEFNDLRLQSESGRRLQLAHSLSLVWLGPACWTWQLRNGDVDLLTSSMELADRPVLRLDPVKLELELDLRPLKREDLWLEDLRLITDGVPRSLDPKPRSGDTTFLCRFSGLEDGPHEGIFELPHRAGGTWRSSFEFVIDSSTEPPRFFLLHSETRRSSWSRTEPEYIYEGEAPGLVIEVDRPLWIQAAWSDANEAIEVTPEAPLRLSLRSSVEGVRPGSTRDIALRVEDRIVCAPARIERHAYEVSLSLAIRERKKLEVGLLAPPASPARRDPLAIESESYAPTYSGSDPVFLELRGGLPTESFELELRSLAVADEPASTRRLGNGRHDIRDLLPHDSGQPREGLQRLRVELYALNEKGDRLADSPNTEVALELRIDSTPPALEVAALRAPPAVVGPGQSLPIELHGTVDSGSEVCIQWSVVREGGLRFVGPRVRPDRWDEPGATCTWSFDPLEVEQRIFALDGTGTLELVAVDLAEHRTPLPSIEFELAREGPRIVFESPRPLAGRIADWDKTGTRLKTIEVSASDANEVQSLRCRVFQVRAGESLELAFEGAPDAERVREIAGISVVQAAAFPSGEVAQSWSFDPGHEWSEASGIYISIEARDRHGSTSIKNNGPFQLPRIHKPYPARVGGMWLVPGNIEQAYTLGGRDPDFENRRLDNPFSDRFWVARGQGKPGEHQETWNLEFAPNAVASYYLDEREVSGAEYSAFLRVVQSDRATAERCFANGVPDLERLALLEARFARDSEAPALGLTFDEAQAYAAWVEKRLPTLLELEYAIRAGSQYRLRSWDAPGSRQPADHSSPWQRVRGLSDGAEWSCTPLWQVGQRGVDARGLPLAPELFAQLEASRLAEAVEFWVNGRLAPRTSVDRTQWRNDFGLHTAMARSSTNSTLSFRCALDAEQAQALAERESARGASSEGEQR